MVAVEVDERSGSSVVFGAGGNKKEMLWMLWV